MPDLPDIEIDRGIGNCTSLVVAASDADLLYIALFLNR